MNLPMAQQSSAPGSAVEAAFLNDAEGSKTSLLDSIFGGPPARSVERRSFSRDAASLDPHRAAESRTQGFVPAAPKSLEEAGLTETEVEDLILKFLFRRGVQSGRGIAEQLHLPFGILQSIFHAMKTSQRIVIARNASVSDYEYSITNKGIEAAKQSNERCTYFGAAPVPFAEYVAAVKAQSMTRTRITLAQVETALADLSVPTALCTRIGKALVEAKAMFIYGAPGNGKTSIAERLTAAYGDSIWIPRAIDCDGEIIRVFDPCVHYPIPTERIGDDEQLRQIDHRWICITRPTVVVGGELTMEHLEVQTNKALGILEAPLQLKSNCGTLVIDDFGRQRISVDQLLNRWIVPLERRYDYLSLPSGKKLQAPFDQLVVFSTNLDPKGLVDEAFLRRIPYKIDVRGPSEAEFCKLFDATCAKMGIRPDASVLEHLIETYFRSSDRHFRYCHVRDILAQVRHHCEFCGFPLELKVEYIDEAAENYFGAA
jgi:predicted ATPase with chaperone activity